MKKILLLLMAVFTVIGASAQQYDFSQQISTGQTLYFKVLDADAKTVEIVPEKNNYANCYTTKPKGEIALPGTIENNGTTYTVTSIGDNAFNYCGDFSGDLIIPNSVTYIGKNAFLGCLSFDGGLTISNKVTTIEEYAFASCIGLTGDLTIPESDTKIGERAFEGCSGLIIK